MKKSNNVFSLAKYLQPYYDKRVILVQKATGEKEPFNEGKIITSMQRAGTPPQIQEQVLKHIKSKLYNGISTEEIYRDISEFLGKTTPLAKTKYSLKRALMALGPTGYPFEDFVATLLETQGYKTSVRNSMQGRCIVHEVDVVAIKGTKRIMIEAKFHNLPGTKTNVHVALYTKARFNDLLDKNNLNEAWLVTNTKVTIDAIAYAACMGMRVISWNYPEGESLRDMIEQSGLSPMTVLTTLTNEQKQKLAQNRIFLAKDICNNINCLDILRLPQEEQKIIAQEAAYISGSKASLARSYLSVP